MQKRYLTITYLCRKLTISNVLCQVLIWLVFKAMYALRHLLLQQQSVGTVILLWVKKHHCMSEYEFHKMSECDPNKKGENTSYPIDVVYTAYNEIHGIVPKLLMLFVMLSLTTHVSANGNNIFIWRVASLKCTVTIVLLRVESIHILNTMNVKYLHPGQILFSESGQRSNNKRVMQVGFMACLRCWNLILI